MSKRLGLGGHGGDIKKQMDSVSTLQVELAALCGRVNQKGIRKGGLIKGDS